MIRTLLSLAVVSTLLLGGIAEAQAPPAKKLYRWVDKDGKVQFSDTLPPEAVDQARTEISAKSGVTTASLDRALTPEERVAKAKLDAQTARTNKEAEQARKTEEAMLVSFQSEEELTRSFQVRTTLLQQTLDAIEAGIASQRASLASLLADASEAELAGQAVNAKHASTILELHVEMNKQQQMLVLKQGELVDLDGELIHLVERFRELKAPAAGSAPATAEPAEAAPPTG